MTDAQDWETTQQRWLGVQTLEHRKWATTDVEPSSAIIQHFLPSLTNPIISHHQRGNPVKMMNDELLNYYQLAYEAVAWPAY